MRAVATLAAVLFVAVLVQTWRLRRASDHELKARAEAQGKTLVDAGWLLATVASQRQLEALVPDLRSQLQAAKDSSSTIAVASHWTGHGAEVAVPCTVVMGPSAGATPPSSSPVPDPGSSGAPPTVAVTPHVKIDDAIALDDLGRIYVARKVQARLSVGESWASSWEAIEPDGISQTKVDPQLVAAWKAYRNPPPRVSIVPRGTRGWRAGWFVGPALTIGFDGKLDAAVSVGWGVQF